MRSGASFGNGSCFSPPLILRSHNKQQLCSCSQKLEAVSKAKGELTVTWLPWKPEHCHALSRMMWQGPESMSLPFKLISPTVPWRSIISHQRGQRGWALTLTPRAGRGLCGSTFLVGWPVKTTDASSVLLRRRPSPELLGLRRAQPPAYKRIA